MRKSVIGFTSIADVLHCLSADGARELLDAPTLAHCRTLLQSPAGASAAGQSDETIAELVWATRCVVTPQPLEPSCRKHLPFSSIA